MFSTNLLTTFHITHCKTIYKETTCIKDFLIQTAISFISVNVQTFCHPHSCAIDAIPFPLLLFVVEIETAEK